MGLQVADRPDSSISAAYNCSTVAAAGGVVTIVARDRQERFRRGAHSAGPRIRAPHLALPSALDCAVPRPDNLLGLTLAEVRSASQHPVLRVPQWRCMIPKLGRNAAELGFIRSAPRSPLRISETDLAPESEVVPLIVDRRSPIRLHANRMVHVAETSSRICSPGSQAHIRHPDQRSP